MRTGIKGFSNRFSLFSEEQGLATKISLIHKTISLENATSTLSHIFSERSYDKMIGYTKEYEAVFTSYWGKKETW